MLPLTSQGPSLPVTALGSPPLCPCPWPHPHAVSCCSSLGLAEHLLFWEGVPECHAWVALP